MVYGTEKNGVQKIINIIYDKRSFTTKIVEIIIKMLYTLYRVS